MSTEDAQREFDFSVPKWPHLQFEQERWAKGEIVCGVDEAGRGPLAGAVFAAAVILPNGFELAGLTDSKKLTAARRAKLEEELLGNGEVKYAVASASVEEIDQHNILRATWLAMARAVSGLGEKVDHALVDGKPVQGLAVEHTALVKGDSRSLSIAAASIFAKQARDRELCLLDAKWPEYGFAKHKGYGTAAHLEALKKHGPCSQHRRSFRPVREAEKVQ